MDPADPAASGQLGQAAVRALQALGDANTEIIALARSPAKAAHLGVETRVGDYEDRMGLEQAFRGVDTALLISGMAPPEERIGQHFNVIDAAREVGVKRLVYTSIVLEPTGALSPVQQCSLDTETYLQKSGLEWTVGHNGLYIEPDLEYIDTYVAEGGIRNSAGHGRCAYTSRWELGRAYAALLMTGGHHGKIYNLVGAAVSQVQLAEAINAAYGLSLTYSSMSEEDYLADRSAALGDFLGPIIAGLYAGIRAGIMDVPSDFGAVVGRPHQSLAEMIAAFRSSAEP
jgi:NAD(P)H dehydrogenase (quinone)